LVAGPCNGDNGDDEDELCANYTSDGVETEYCAACGDGICEDIERCVSSSCSNNTCTSDCGPLYCIEDCEDEDGNGAGRNKTKVEFFPWQKRNESECLEGCECHGAVQSCETEDGKTMTIEAGRSGNIITITVEKNGNRSECNTSLEMEQERDREKNETRLYTYLSNGRKAEVKIMPDAASEKAIERLGELNFTVELKEIGKGEEVQLAYELKAGKEGKILGLFRKQAQLGIEVSAENGEVIRVRRPWWAFLATGV